MQREVLCIEYGPALRGEVRRRVRSGAAGVEENQAGITLGREVSIREYCTALVIAIEGLAGLELKCARVVVHAQRSCRIDGAAVALRVAVHKRRLRRGSFVDQRHRGFTADCSTSASPSLGAKESKLLARRVGIGEGPFHVYGTACRSGIASFRIVALFSEGHVSQHHGGTAVLPDGAATAAGRVAAGEADRVLRRALEGHIRVVVMSIDGPSIGPGLRVAVVEGGRAVAGICDLDRRKRQDGTAFRLSPVRVAAVEQEPSAIFLHRERAARIDAAAVTVVAARVAAGEGDVACVVVGCECAARINTAAVAAVGVAFVKGKRTLELVQGEGPSGAHAAAGTPALTGKEHDGAIRILVHECHRGIPAHAATGATGRLASVETDLAASRIGVRECTGRSHRPAVACGVAALGLVNERGAVLIPEHVARGVLLRSAEHDVGERHGGVAVLPDGAAAVAGRVAAGKGDRVFRRALEGHRRRAGVGEDGAAR